MSSLYRFKKTAQDAGAALLYAPAATTDALTNLGSLTLPDGALKNGAKLVSPGLIDGGVAVELDGVNQYIDTGWECKVSTATLVQQLGSETFVYTLRQLDNGDILAGTQPQGAVYRSKDNGATWALVKENVAGASIIHEIIDLGKGVVLAATDNKGKVARSTDYGATWNEGTALGEEERVNCFTDLGGGVVLAGTRTALKGGKVFRSTDNGVTWGAGQALGGVNQGVNWMSGLGKNVVILGGFDDLKVNWFRSTDNGATWARIESEVLNATNGEYGHTGANIGEGVALIATYDSSGAGAPHIYRTIDYGVTWKSVHTGSGIQGFFCIEHVGNGRLLAGSGINPATCRIYISEDDGLTWSIFQQGLGKTATHVLAMAHIPAADRVLIAAGTTGEVWSAEVALPFVNGAARTFVGVALRDTSTSWDVLLGSNGTEADEAHSVVSLSIAENSNDVHFHANVFITASTWTDAWPGTDVAVFWALVFDEPNNTVELFINGVSKGSKAITAQFSTTPGALTLGIRKNTIFALDGALLPFSVFLGKLSANQVELLYNATQPLPRRLRRKPDLALDWEVEGPAGSLSLPSDSRRASKRPRGGNFSTLRGDGFGPGGLTLSREIFRDHADIGLLDTWRAISRSGGMAYESRLHSAPRTNDPQEQIDIVLTGWATYLKSRKCAPLVVDRRFGGWGEPSLARRDVELKAGGTYAHYSASSAFDGVKFDGGSGSSIPLGARGELVYDAGDVNRIAKLIYKGTQQNTGSVEAAILFTDDDPAFPSAASKTLTIDDTLRTAEPTTPEQYAMLRAQASATHTPVAGSPFARTLEYLALYGNTGLTTRSISGEPDGVWLSDLITYIAQAFYPKIDISEVQTNSTLVQQATWHDNPSYGYDIIAELNKLALWELNVWEDRKLHFYRGDLTKYDWQFRTDDPGVQVIFQGDSIENFANGVEVTYTDVLTGVKHTLLPSDHDELRDDSESNPANRHGEKLWTDVEVPWQATEAEALQIGRAYLPEYNRPKRPGSYTVTGHIEDSSGQWHAGWEPRCSQTVGIIDHPEDAPRLITATSWDEESKQLRITVDSTDKRLEAIIARQVLASQAMNLG